MRAGRRTSWPAADLPGQAFLVESDCGAVPGFLLARFRRPLAEPDETGLVVDQPAGKLDCGCGVAVALARASPVVRRYSCSRFSTEGLAARTWAAGAAARAPTGSATRCMGSALIMADDSRSTSRQPPRWGCRLAFHQPVARAVSPEQHRSPPGRRPAGHACPAGAPVASSVMPYSTNQLAVLDGAWCNRRSGGRHPERASRCDQAAADGVAANDIAAPPQPAPPRCRRAASCSETLFTLPRVGSLHGRGHKPSMVYR